MTMNLVPTEEELAREFQAKISDCQVQHIANLLHCRDFAGGDGLWLSRDRAFYPYGCLSSSFGGQQKDFIVEYHAA